MVFGNPETTTGGYALKFYSSVRLDIRQVGQVKEGDSIVGSRTRVKVVKNKFAPPIREAEFDIRYGTGVDRMLEAAGLCGCSGRNLLTPCRRVSFRLGPPPLVRPGREGMAANQTCAERPQ